MLAGANLPAKSVNKIFIKQKKAFILPFRLHAKIHLI